MNHGGGLTILTKDERDFKFGSIFGTPKLFDLPNEYSVGQPLIIKDQGETDMCTAFASTEVSEDQEGIELSPEWFFAQEKKRNGDFASWGSDLRTACKTAVGEGFLEQERAKYNWKSDGRDFCSNWANWPLDLSFFAKKHAKQSYYAVDYPYDIFDSFRAVMWQNRAEKRSLLVGTMWRQGWLDSAIIPEDDLPEVSGHAFKIFGWKVINGQTYLTAQLSNGDVGDKGIFYFPRSVINRDFGTKYGAFTFKDLSPEHAQTLIEKELSINWLWWVKIINFLRNYFKELIK